MMYSPGSMMDGTGAMMRMWGMGMWGMGLIWALGIVVLILAAAALAKYVFFSGGRQH